MKTFWIPLEKVYPDLYLDFLHPCYVCLSLQIATPILGVLYYKTLLPIIIIR